MSKFQRSAIDHAIFIAYLFMIVWSYGYMKESKIRTVEKAAPGPPYVWTQTDRTVTLAFAVIWPVALPSAVIAEWISNPDKTPASW